ncbi:hypothetical protein E8L90_04815 [Brevibacillus antibioticus]|uniref:Uncharacterized protein n=1 Tax=Brevibacillus antibioticus TaxID=2570228 RepID=A0A4U2Y312_9BACL|nr:hypothetical protein [Brevibacillus antibioticus]TKI54816.1 hypothetical protein E8L90_04815 [Brevibacillus antibioticus]
MIKLTKVMVSRYIAEKLGLKSDRMLWMSDSDSRQFLDEWFDRLKQEIEIIAGETTFSGNINTGNELERRIKQLKIQIEVLLNENKTLKEENFHLRMLSFDKFGKADA